MPYQISGGIRGQGGSGIAVFAALKGVEDFRCWLDGRRSRISGLGLLTGSQGQKGEFSAGRVHGLGKGLSLIGSLQDPPMSRQRW
jgi:hypothetical protein